jgi:hypothetical protein
MSTRIQQQNIREKIKSTCMSFESKPTIEAKPEAGIGTQFRAKDDTLFAVHHEIVGWKRKCNLLTIWF